jgi:hypothetical protein
VAGNQDSEGHSGDDLIFGVHGGPPLAMRARTAA